MKTMSDKEDGYTLDAEEQKRRIAERKKKLLEAEDFTLTPQEIEARKHSATETETQ